MHDNNTLFLEWFFNGGQTRNGEKNYLQHRETPSSQTKATERVAPRVTTKEESTYITSNKDLQNIHRNRTNAERHTGRSLRDVSNRRTTYVGVGVPDDPHSRKNDSANPYGSPVKIVGDNVTEKDYEDFWNAFRNEGKGNRLNWAANQIQTQSKPQSQSTPRIRNSQNMMQWAMNSGKNLAPARNIAGRRYITDEDEAFREGFFGKDYKRDEELRRRVNTAIHDKNSRRAGDTLRTYLSPENNITTKQTNDSGNLPLRKIYDIPESGRYGWLRAIKAGSEIIENADTVKVFQLKPTHRINKSKRQMEELMEDIQKNGIKDPIKYINYDGNKYVVEGHHRLHTARMLGIDNVPAEEVQLPYKSYITTNDLFWK